MLVIEIIGNLGGDAAVRTANGKEYVTFSVAHTTGSGEGKTTVWVSCLWRSSGGNLLQHLTKGTRVFVRGDYSDALFTRRDGTVAVSRSVTVREVTLCGGERRGVVESPRPGTRTEAGQPAVELGGDDVPF